MASLISGFEYDIFISYRQKDNKGDRWVSKFVEALKTELEATFKEDISVYFDENPHDRLQETHNVDKSLEGKLKCLIFIPILSQTYCDPNSYAWQYEFLVFNKLANEDIFGRDVRLRSGNVASRILPVRIHDLEQEDIKLFEKETGSVLRAMDFVFKTASGVNRPLKPNEDHPQDNLDKTFYSDQINKVAHAIKEIIQGMKIEPVLEVREKDQPRESFKEVREDERKIDLEKPSKAGKNKLLSSLAVLTVLIIAGILAYPKIFKRSSLEKLKSSGERISVAVMPFQNMTNDTIWNIWQDGIQFNLITALSNYSEELKVSQTESINNLLQSKGLTNYASITPSIASTISQKLDANLFIYGNINQVGKTIRVNAQIIDSKTKESFKSFQLDGIAENILPIIDSLSVMIKNFLIISELKKDLPLYFKYDVFSGSPEAFRYFISGRKEFMKRDYSSARSWLFQTISLDSNFFDAITMVSLSYGNEGDYDEAKKWCLRAYKKRDQMSVQQQLNANRVYAEYFETPREAIKYLKQRLDYDDKDPIVLYNLGRCYSDLYQYDKAIPELEKALEIYNKWGTKPYWVWNYTYLGYSYHKTGMYKKEKKLYKKAEKDFPDDPYIILYQAILSLTEGDTISANDYIRKLMAYAKENSAPEAAIASGMASLYSEAGILDKAEKYYRKALSLEPEKAWTLNNLAYFLIDKDRNVNEGMDLVERALKLKPNNIDYLGCKGWGFYKQGKNKEALELLEKYDSLKPVYDHEAFLHLEAAKKAVASQKNN
jgi:tetratricopeptide (TPR) repeat protein